MKRNPYPPIFDLCHCGCNEIVWNGKEFIHGHNGRGKPRSEKFKKYLSEINKGENNPCFGKKPSEETRLKKSIIMKGKNHDGLFKRGQTPWNRGLTKEIDERLNKLSKKRMGIIFSNEHLENLSVSHKNQKPSEEHKKILSKLWKGESNPSWKGGISYLPYCPKFNNKLKEQIRNRDNYICQKCGKIENGRRHSVHHVHYDKENCYPDLITLCVGCNSKVNYNRNYWEEYFMNILEDKNFLNWKSMEE